MTRPDEAIKLADSLTGRFQWVSIALAILLFVGVTSCKFFSVHSVYANGISSPSFSFGAMAINTKLTAQTNAG
jgi:hypothetical protein